MRCTTTALHQISCLFKDGWKFCTMKIALLLPFLLCIIHFSVIFILTRNLNREKLAIANLNFELLCLGLIATWDQTNRIHSCLICKEILKWICYNCLIRTIFERGIYENCINKCMSLYLNQLLNCIFVTYLDALSASHKLTHIIFSHH